MDVFLVMGVCGVQGKTWNHYYRGNTCWKIFKWNPRWPQRFPKPVHNECTVIKALIVITVNIPYKYLTKHPIDIGINKQKQLHKQLEIKIFDKATTMAQHELNYQKVWTRQYMAPLNKEMDLSSRSYELDY